MIEMDVADEDILYVARLESQIAHSGIDIVIGGIGTGFDEGETFRSLEHIYRGIAGLVQPIRVDGVNRAVLRRFEHGTGS